jgi:hypothetical protein
LEDKMGRKRSSGVLSDLFQITAFFPWWVGVALAVAAYVLLHWYAVKPLEPATTPGHVAAFNPSPIYKGLAQAFQYILPIVFLGGAVASAIGRMTRKALVTKVAGAKSPGVLQDDGLHSVSIATLMNLQRDVEPRDKVLLRRMLLVKPKIVARQMSVGKERASLRKAPRHA